MRIELSQGEGVTAIDLPEGGLSLGGGDGDGVRLEGQRTGLIRLLQEEAGVFLELAEPLMVGAALCPAGVRRLLVPGEQVCLPAGAGSLAVIPQAAARRTEGTVALLSGLLGAGDAGDAALATLTCLTGLDAGKTLALADGIQVLGRGEVALRIRDRSVSRRHARVSTDGGVTRVCDLGGPNGVFLNGARLGGEAELVAGDIIELGHTLLRYARPEPAAPEQVAPGGHGAGAASGLEEASAAPRVGGRASRRPGWHELIVAIGALVAITALVASYGVLSGPSRPDGGEPGAVDQQLHQRPVLGEEAGEVQRGAQPADRVHGDRPGKDVHLADVRE